MVKQYQENVKISYIWGRNEYICPTQTVNEKKSMHDVVDVVVITMQENIVKFFFFLES